MNKTDSSFHDTKPVIMVGPGKCAYARERIQGREMVKKIYLCKKYFQQCTMPPLTVKICLDKYQIFVTPPPWIYYPLRNQMHLPHHGKKFCAKESRICFLHLGLINLCLYLIAVRTDIWPASKDTVTLQYNTFNNITMKYKLSPCYNIKFLFIKTASDHKRK